MPAPKIVVPNFQNHTPGSIVDELGKMSVMENYLKKMRKLWREALDSKLSRLAEEMGQPLTPDDTANLLVGEKFSATISPGERTSVNQEYVKQHHPRETNPEYYATIITNTLRTKSLTDPELNAWMESLRQELGLDELNFMGGES